MPKKTFKFTGLTGGLYAAANLFDMPRGTVPRISNLVYTRRGGLQTVDGSRVISKPADSNPGPYAPIVALDQYNPAGVPGPQAHLFGMTLDAMNNGEVVDLTPALWTGVFGGPFPNSGPTLMAVQFSNSMVFAFGLNVQPQLYDPIQAPGLVGIANTFQATTTYPPWLSATQYVVGTKVLGAPASSSISYIWRAQNTGLSQTPGPPLWTAGIGDQVADGNITWINKGPAGAEAPPGAAFVFNHLNSLWVWGTAPTYMTTGPNAGIDGPDSLRMSDSGNPTSFDPSNQSFVGQGDGQLPMGGATWAQLEVGIPVTAQLLLFKTKDTYSVIGAFPAVSIAKMPDGVGCAAPSTIQVVPGIGIMRLSLFGVAVFEGTRDVVDQFTDPIRPYLFPEEADVAGEDITPVDWNNIVRATATQTVSPPGYLLLVPLLGSNGALTRAFFFDRLLKAWTVIDFPAGMPLAGALFNVATSAQSMTLVAGFNDGVVRQLFAGDEMWDVDQPDGTLIQWNFIYPAVGSPGTPLYYRRTLFRASVLGQAANLRAASILLQDRNGDAGVEDMPLAVDATALTQAIDIDRTELGGLLFQLNGQGRMLAQGLEIQYEPKETSRIPAFT